MSKRSETYEDFSTFFATTEPKLRKAFAAQFGPSLGADAAAEALSYGWAHRERVLAMDNPAGYLFRVGNNWARKSYLARRPAFAIDEAETRLPHVEPGLLDALAQLTDQQRIAVLLVDGMQWHAAEVGELLGISATTVRSHRDRALMKLRASLGVTS